MDFDPFAPPSFDGDVAARPHTMTGVHSIPGSVLRLLTLVLGTP